MTRINLLCVVTISLLCTFQPLCHAANPAPKDQSAANAPSAAAPQPSASAGQTLHSSTSSAASSASDAIDCSKEQDRAKCRYVSHKVRNYAGVGSFLALVVLIGLLTGFKFSKYVVGMDCRYSNSKCQMALWFFVLLWGYCTFTAIRIYAFGWDYLGGIGITENLLLLSGMSALTFGGAKAITTAKDQAARDQNATAALMPPALAPTPVLAPVKTTAARPCFPNDLVNDDAGNADFGDLQMIVFLLLSVCVYLAQLYKWFGMISPSYSTSLPDIDTTLLSVFGLGQGAYLVKKYAGNIGTS